MSSRSLAAARARRAGENAPPVSGSRPGTSIGSHAAFAQQGYQQSANVRVARQPVPQQMNNRQTNAFKQVQQSQQNHNSLPFSKLSISDAIGLITLRLGRVEQWVIETVNENENENETNKNDNTNINLNDGSKVIDNSILTSIINRLDSLETKGGEFVDNENVSKLSEEVSRFTEQLTKINDECVKQNMIISKHTEQLFKFERELIETKDILKTFMIKYDVFAKETNDKFTDYEYAISELEKTIQPPLETNSNITLELEDDDKNNTSNNDNEGNNSIMSVDLKNIIKQELAGEN
jgi:predicted  nucleic acid-binding Zn-ribbon protein